MAYDLEPDAGPPPPALPGTVLVRDTPDSVIGALASDMLAHAFGAVERFDEFHLALSGGSTPVPLYRRLMIDPAFRAFPWKRTHVWLADERRVGPEDERSNYRLIREMLGDHADLPSEQLHRVRTEEDDAPERYERDLLRELSFRPDADDRRIDFALLGMGSDGHTASLFPHSPALGADALVASNDGPSVTPPPRITLTYRALNEARFLAVLVVGDSKREAIERALTPGASHEDLPVLGLNPEAGELRWYMDGAACPGGERAC